MAVLFTARLRVRDWRALRRLSDERLMLFARAAGARRYQLFRDSHDAAEALVLVEADAAEALQVLRTALLQLDAAQHDNLAIELSPSGKCRLWEPSGCGSIG